MFQPSSYSYGAIDTNALMNLIGTDIQVGGSVATTAITAGSRPRGGGKKKHKARMQEIAALTPDHSPMWPVAIGIVVAGGLVYMVFSRKKGDA